MFLDFLLAIRPNLEYSLGVMALAQQTQPDHPAPPASGPDYLTHDELMERLRLLATRNRNAARMALERAWKRAQDVRHDKRMPPLVRIQVGRGQYLYTAETVAQFIEALLTED
jgi:hypothetical protein